MIIKMKAGISLREKKHIIEVLGKKGLKIKEITGERYGILGVIGDTSKVDIRDVEALNGVEKVTRVQEPFKLVNRMFKGRGRYLYSNSRPLLSGEQETDNRGSQSGKEERSPDTERRGL